MDKIDHLNYFAHLNSKIKKDKSKKTKSENTDKIKSENKSTFEEIYNLQDIKPKTFQSQNQNQEYKLENLLKEIGNQGEKLKKSRLLEELDKYKKLVKEYISIFLQLSEEAEKKTLWDRNKKEKVSKVHLKIINQELSELTRIFFEEQQNTFAIAAKIDRIEGLLIDLKL